MEMEYTLNKERHLFHFSVLSDPKFRPGTSRISLLGSNVGNLEFDTYGAAAGAEVTLPPMERVQKLKYAWVLKVEGAK